MVVLGKSTQTEITQGALSLTDDETERTSGSIWSRYDPRGAPVSYVAL